MITAKIICDSITRTGNRITTFELEYPRFIHGELMTHRAFSRNAASSRAIPIKKMIEQVSENPATPAYWGKNQSGMQAGEELSGLSLALAKARWDDAAKQAVMVAEKLEELGVHKQVTNRLLEPFQVMKTVVTATSFDNFFWLRCHSDAQPEIKILADKMYEAYTMNKPKVLDVGMWHLPYVEMEVTPEGVVYGTDLGGISLTQAQKVSASCCAQVSYRTLDTSLERAERIYDCLVESKPVHASPMEHLATPRSFEYEGLRMPKGVTHIDREGEHWSGNFKGWVQYRQLLPENVCNRFTGH